jgi:histidyl-tRNA synthetase
MLLDATPRAVRPIAMVPVGDAAVASCLALAEELRRAGLTIEMGYRGKVGQRLKRADRLNARYAVLVGDDELAKGTVQLRDLDGGEQREVPRGELPARLAAAAAGCA